MRMRYLVIAGASAIAAAIAAATPAQAQSVATAELDGDGAANQDVRGVDDIVVTAERLTTTTQRAPLTVQVLSGEDVERKGITDAFALQQATSGVQISQSGGSTQIFIRGVGSAASNPMSVPGVAFNVDGIYVGRPEGTGGNFYDLARVEVVKGPQGTLYGRNATGGAINLITNEPRIGARTMDLSLEAGNYELVRATGALNLPLGNNAAIRAAFNIISRDGYLSDGSFDDVQQSGRLRLKWEPSPSLSLLLNGDYTHLGGKGYDRVYLPQRPGGSPWEAQSSAAANAYQNSLPGGLLIDDVADDTSNDTHLYNVSAQLDWRLPFASFTLIPAYRRSDVNYVTHFGARAEIHNLFDQYSLEARLSHSSAALTWVLGGYYFDENTVRGETLARSSAALNQRVISEPATTSYAAFGQATLSVTDRLRLIGGLRYTSENKKFIGSNTNLTTGVTRNFTGDKTFNKVSYRVGAEYDVAPSNLLYATYSTGDKSGGFSPTPLPNEYQPEQLAAFEIGSKNRFFDNRLQLNLSGFYWNYKGIQDTRPAIDSSGSLGVSTFNSGDATLYGGTLEMVARPTPADTLSFLVEYTHSRYDAFSFLAPSLPPPAPPFNPASTGCQLSGPYAPGAALPVPVYGLNANPGPSAAFLGNCAGLQVARVPEWSGSASYNHDFTMADGGTVAVGASVTYASARWITIDFIAAERDNPYALVDASLTYIAPDKRYTISLFGRNLTNSVYYTGGIQNAVITGLVAASIGAPRTYGVRASFRFGN